MKVQYNQQTKMWWNYIPTSVARKLGLVKGDELEYLENTDSKIFIVKKKEEE